MFNPKLKNLHQALLSISVLYAAHTVPLYFVTFAIPTILRSEGISLTMIGMLGMLLIPWTFKFLWAPSVDRWYIRILGRRKSWIIPTQFCILLLLAALGFIYPVSHTALLYCILFFISLFAATQAIACGGFIVDQIPREQQRWGNFTQVIGTTIGSAGGGAITIYCYAQWGWSSAIFWVISLSSLLLLTSLFSKERKITYSIQPLPSIKNFWQRPTMRSLLLMCIIYRSCEGLVMGMQQAFLVDLGIKISTIGIIMGIGNASIGLLAAGIAGALLKPFGEWRMLFFLACLRTIAYVGLFIIASNHINQPSIVFSIVLLNMATRLMEMVVLYTLFMKQCSPHQAATDFSIFICAELIIYMIGMSLSGLLAESMGYSNLFLLGTFLSIPCLLLIPRFSIKFNCAIAPCAI